MQKKMPSNLSSSHRDFDEFVSFINPYLIHYVIKNESWYTYLQNLYYGTYSNPEWSTLWLSDVLDPFYDEELKEFSIDPLKIDQKREGEMSNPYSLASLKPQAIIGRILNDIQPSNKQGNQIASSAMQYLQITAPRQYKQFLSGLSRPLFIMITSINVPGAVSTALRISNINSIKEKLLGLLDYANRAQPNVKFLSVHDKVWQEKYLCVKGVYDTGIMPVSNLIHNLIEVLAARASNESKVGIAADLMPVGHGAHLFINMIAAGHKNIKKKNQIDQAITVSQYLQRYAIEEMIEKDNLDIGINSKTPSVDEWELVSEPGIVIKALNILFEDLTQRTALSSRMSINDIITDPMGWIAIADRIMRIMDIN
jgi:hypothetical protein